MGAGTERGVGGEGLRRLLVFNGGFFDRRLRRILHLVGWQVHLGLPGPGDTVGLWGASPTAWRGAAVAARRGAPILRVEDAFLRSVRPGRAGSKPLGLLLDVTGVHFDGSGPSDLETLLSTHPLDDPALLARAASAMEWLQTADLSKYNAHDPDLAPPPPGYVLVIDQTLGDASVRASGGSPARFAAMLAAAEAEHPGAPILLKVHPETRGGLRPGHFTAAQGQGRVRHYDDPVSPWKLLAGARAVYTHSSQFGFEAILAGARPVVFGQPFYAGWGLSDDRAPPARRGRQLAPQQLFAAAMILAPTWYDPARDRLATLEEAIAALEAEVRAWRDDRHGWVGAGMRLWKRAPLGGFFGGAKPMRYAEGAEAAALAGRTGRRLMVWAGKLTPDLRAAGAVRVEDGFLRSRGLGATLVPPLSLVLDGQGIYYDPTARSGFEALVAQPLTPRQRARAEALIAGLITAGVTKYNLGGAGLPEGLAQGRRILVPGQVEDDASIRLGAGAVRTNRALLLAARQANPEAVLLYKPHPDVEAGLRPGAVGDAAEIADAVLERADPAALLAQVDEVWTMTSAIGFEALLRGVAVTTLGAPFYAGWGLTHDLGPVPERRTARPDLATLAHAALIAYPRYHDPVSRRPCPPEVALERLASGDIPAPGTANRLLSKLQGAFASQAWLWRRR